MAKASARRVTPRKRPVQQELFRRGGRRRRAGRKPARGRAGSRHRARATVNSYHALHVVMRVVEAVGSLRKRAMYQALREATITAALRQRFRIVHISIQRTHVHMLVEAEHAQALARGMQGFQIAAARNINTRLATNGRRAPRPGFSGRPHLEVITTPRRARHVLAYVLNNWRKHNEDRAGVASTWLGGPVATRVLFDRR